jgi:NADH-quinone oxidoreductase subunit M
LYQHNAWFAAIAGISIILSAVYTLNMVQKVFYGEDNILTKVVSQVTAKQKIILSVIVMFIFVLGFYPKPVFDLTKDFVTNILAGLVKK